MTLFKLNVGKLNIPVFDLGAVVSGLYIGYCEGKGIDVGDTLKYAAKYGPTILALSLTPLSIKLYKKIANKVINEHVEEDAQNILRTRIDQTKYLEPTMLSGARTSVETLAGYVVGKTISHLEQFIS